MKKSNDLIEELIEDHGVYVDTANRRSTPNIVNGMKVVHLHILQGCIENNYFKNTIKSAKVVGQVMGELHPHGDAAIYDAIAHMLNTHEIRYPYLEGQGSFGSVDGDAPSAMRYTEMKLGKLFRILIDYTIIGNDDVHQSIPNYDESLREWKFLIMPYNPILMNGSTGIGVGNATNIPPMNLYDIQKLYKLGMGFLKEILKKNKKINLHELLVGKYSDRLLDFNFKYMFEKTGSNLIVPDFPIPIRVNVTDATVAMIRGKGAFKYRADYRLIKDKNSNGISSIEIIGIMYQSNEANVKERLGKYISDNAEIYDIKEYNDSKSMLNNDIVINTIEFNNPKDKRVANTIANNVINSISGLSGNYNVNYKAMSDNGSTIIDTNPFYVTITSLIRFIFGHRSDIHAKYNKTMQEFYMKSVIYNSISKFSSTKNKDKSVLHSVVEILRESDQIDEDLMAKLDLYYCDLKHKKDENYPTSQQVLNYIKNTPLGRLRTLAGEVFSEDLIALNDKAIELKKILTNEFVLLDYVESIYSNLESKIHEYNKVSMKEIKVKANLKPVYQRILKKLGIELKGLIERKTLPIIDDGEELSGDVVDTNKPYTLFVSSDNRTLLFDGHINVTDISDKLNQKTIKEPFLVKKTLHLHAGADLLIYTYNRCYKLKIDNNFINNNLRLLNNRLTNKDMIYLYSNGISVKANTELIEFVTINEYPARLLYVRSDDAAYIYELNKKKIPKNGIAVFSGKSSNLTRVIPVNKDDNKLLIATTNNKFISFKTSLIPIKEDGVLAGIRLIGGRNNNILDILPFSNKSLPISFFNKVFNKNTIRDITTNKLSKPPKRI